ncbi:MAG: glycosyltransferase [Actinomycetota bacterium]
MSAVLDAVATVSMWVVLVAVVISIVSQVGLFASAVVELRRIRLRDRHQLWRRMLSSPLAPKITILVPAYNEELSIGEATTQLLSLTYPNLEVVVVNDGSRDDTMGQLQRTFSLSPVLPVFRKVVDTKPVRQLYRSPEDERLVVVDKDNGGKADALNAALNVASGDLVCAIDADTIVAPDALQQMVAPFLSSRRTVAVGGTIRLVNNATWRMNRVDVLHAPRKPIVGAQAVEYARSFLVGRLAWNPIGGNIIISGAFGVFRRGALIDVGGYEHASIGEDMELIVRLRRAAYERGEPAIVEFTPDPVAFTEAPESIRTLARQRNRWFRGLLDVLVRHRRMMLNPQYGTAGMLSLPYFLVVEALAPVMEIVGLLTLAVLVGGGWLPPDDLIPLAVAYLASIAASYLVLILDDLVFSTYQSTRDRLLLSLHVLFEQLVFRPMTTVWRLWGLQLFLRGRTEWGAQQRRGFTTPAHSAT